MRPPDLADTPPPRLDEAEIRQRIQSMADLDHAAKILGFELIDLSVQEGWIEASFDPDPLTANLRGSVQGGMICAMLDEVMSWSVVIAEGFTVGVPTLEMKTSYFAPLPLGKSRGRGEAVRVGRNVGFMEGTIWTPDGEIAAKGSATCQVRRPRAPKPVGDAAGKTS